MKQSLQDLVAFGRIVSGALLICGYVVLGVYLGRQLVGRGWPDWSAVVLFCAAAIFGLWQGWIFVRPLWKKEK